MTNGNEQPKKSLSKPAKLIVEHLCREIIGPRHEIDWSRYEDPNEEIDMIIQDKIDQKGGNEL